MCDCAQAPQALTFETMLSDPMIRLMMDRDGVSVEQLVAVMEIARAALVSREREAVQRAVAPHARPA